MSNAIDATKDVVIKHAVNAPLEDVWAAWTVAEDVEKWWGPEGFSSRVEKLELKNGGLWRFVLIGPNGKEYPSDGEFREVVPNEKLVMTDHFDEGTDYGVKFEDLPRDIITSVHFEENDGATNITIILSHPNGEEKIKHEKMGVVIGFKSQLRCLEAFLAGQK